MRNRACTRTLPCSGFTSFIHSPDRFAKIWPAGIGRPVTGSVLWCKAVKSVAKNEQTRVRRAAWPCSYTATMGRDLSVRNWARLLRPRCPPIGRWRLLLQSVPVQKLRHGGWAGVERHVFPGEQNTTKLNRLQASAQKKEHRTQSSGQPPWNLRSLSR